MTEKHYSYQIKESLSEAEPYHSCSKVFKNFLDASGNVTDFEKLQGDFTTEEAHRLIVLARIYDSPDYQP